MDQAHVRENTRISSIPTKQINPTSSATTTNLVNMQPNNTLVADLF
jgi:hypothetical protein